MNNIRSFREDPNWLNKIGSGIFYILLGWYVASVNIFALGGMLSMFMIIGLICWALILRRRTIKYFVRFHVAQALLLNMALAAALWLLAGIIDLLSTLPLLNIVGGYLVAGLTTKLSVFELIEVSLLQLVTLTLAGINFIYCLRGAYTELPWITYGVREWL